MEGKKNDCYNILLEKCNNAKKVILLDGDISNRSKTFISHLENSNTKYIVNNKQKLQYNFQYVGQHEFFNSQIDDCLKNGKNIAIVSMDASMAISYYDKYKNKYNSVLYTGNTDDKEKKRLAVVNEVWSDKRLIVYSPAIEAGVDFNINHVNKIFVILSSSSSLKYCSTSQRGLMQMIARIRQFDDKNILVYKKWQESILLAYLINKTTSFH